MVVITAFSIYQEVVIYKAPCQVLCSLLYKIITVRYDQETAPFFSHYWYVTSELPVPPSTTSQAAPTTCNSL